MKSEPVILRDMGKKRIIVEEDVSSLVVHFETSNLEGEWERPHPEWTRKVKLSHIWGSCKSGEAQGGS